MLTIDQVAEKLHISRNTVVTLIKKGQIKAVKIGSQYRISDEQFNQFMSASEIVPDKF